MINSVQLYNRTAYIFNDFKGIETVRFAESVLVGGIIQKLDSHTNGIMPDYLADVLNCAGINIQTKHKPTNISTFQVLWDTILNFYQSTTERNIL